MSSGPVPAARRPAPGRRLAWRLLFILLAVLVVAVVLDLVRLGLTARDLDRSVNRLLVASSALGTQPTGWTEASVAAADRVNSAEGPRIHAAVLTLRSDPLIRVARHLPVGGDNVRASLDLAGAADAAGASYPDLLQIARSYVTTSGGQGSPGARILALLQSTGPPAADAAAHLKPAVRPTGP